MVVVELIYEEFVLAISILFHDMGFVLTEFMYGVCYITYPISLYTLTLLRNFSDQIV